MPSSKDKKGFSKVESGSDVNTVQNSTPKVYIFKEPSIENLFNKVPEKPNKQVNELLCTPSAFRGKSRNHLPSPNPGGRSTSEFGEMTQWNMDSGMSRNTLRKPTSQMGSTFTNLSKPQSRFNIEPQSVHRRDSRRPRVFAERLEGLKGLVDQKKLQEAECNIVRDLVLKKGGDLKSKFKMLDRVDFMLKIRLLKSGKKIIMRI